MRRALVSTLLPLFLAVSAHAGEPQVISPPQADMRDDAPLMSWPDLLGRPLPLPTQSIRMGDGATDIVDLWLPEGEGPHPVVLMIHGGCWQKAIADRTLMNYSAEALRAAGIAVWNIEYRGVDEEGGGYPGTFLDVGRAADALMARGSEFGLDTSKVVAFGHSAGGHLALWAAGRHRLSSSSALYTEYPARLYGVVNSGGLADLEASEQLTLKSCLADIRDRLEGPNGFAETSPAYLLPIGTVQVSINGVRDRIAPPILGEQWTLKADLSGDEAHFVEVPGGHVELVSPDTEAFETELAAIRRLLLD